MENKNYAAIDIGSNAVRLLIKKVTTQDNGEAKFAKNILCRCDWVLTCSRKAKSVRPKKNGCAA